MKKIIVHVCYFRRDKESKKEKGIMMGEGGSIIDMNGERVPEIYDCDSYFHEGSFVVNKYLP